MKKELTQAEKTDNALRRQRFLQQLGHLPDFGVSGFFGPGSASWQLYREPVVLLGGIRALLLQIAHPAIADGVNRYSNFREDALDRGRRTFMAMAKIYFGDAETARQTALQLHTIHSFIRGAYTDKEGKSISYCANDPELLLWVLATLIDTTYQVFEAVKGPLPEYMKVQFYKESKTTALLMGIPAAYFPPTLDDFRNYFSKTVAEDLHVNDTTMQLAAAILDNRYSGKRLSEALAVGFLPKKLIAAFHLKDTPKVRRRFDRVIRIARALQALTPLYLRTAPAWHQAHYRLDKNEGRSPKWLGRFYVWLGEKMHIPLGI